jgi:predicted NAD/FAD-binding protein
MTDVFGKKLLNIYKDKLSNKVVVAFSKQQAIQLLKESNIVEHNISIMRNIGYAGIESKIL